MALTVLQQAASDRQRVAVVGGREEHSVALERGPVLGRQAGLDQVPGEVRSGRQAHEPAHPLRPRQRHEQHDPAAHAGADQDHWTDSDLVQHCKSVGAPVADAATLEPAARRTMSAVVEAQEALAPLCAVPLQVERLGTRHVGAEAGQEHHRRGPTGRAPHRRAADSP